jgi:hypothetical protein
MPMNSGLKVFMDARMPVTHEEGDRYPLGPPVYGVVSLVVKPWVVIPLSRVRFSYDTPYAQVAQW